MVSAWVFLVLGVAGLLLAANVVHPAHAPGPVAVVSFFAGWLVGELAPHAFAAQVAFAALFVHAGALAFWPGVVGLTATAAACALLLFSQLHARRARSAFDRALRDGCGERADVSPDDPTRHWFAPALGIGHLAMPFPVRHGKVTCSENLAFWRDGSLTLRLDVHRAKSHHGPVPKPTFIYVHGGAWMIGHRQRQGLPLLQHLAARGWACFSVDYRLSPRATFPDHLVDVKRAIAWVREHAAEFGADPDFVVIGGNSAGGHLASLAALTANDPAYQPGFEDRDTSVQACTAFYGVYDFLDRNGHWRHPGMLRLLERHVMKQTRASARSAYDAASPMGRVHAGAPPFLVVHGECDSVCPVGEARSFADALRATSREAVAYVELPGAQHAFDIFPSVRTAHSLEGVTRFLAFVYGRRKERAEAHTPLQSGFRRSSSQSRAAGT
jgi:acetyl esterase/lipase